MADMVKWAVATKEAFTALAAKDANTIYFVSDTHEIYKGAEAYAKGVEKFAGVDARPAVGAEGRLYVDTQTGAGYVFESNAWVKVIAGVGAIEADSTDLATAGAVYAHVAEQINEVTGGALTDVSYDETAKTLSVTKAGETTTKTLTGFVTGLSYANGKISATDVSGAEVASLNLELERFLQDAYYDDATSKLVFEVKVEGQADVTKIEIPAAEFVALYEGADTNTLDLTIETVEGGANKISGAVKVSAEAGNLIVAKEDGLYVAPVDQSAKMDLVTGAVANDIATLNAQGQAVDSGKAFGAEAFAETPGAALIPTEASVAAHVATKIQASEATAANTYATKTEVNEAVATINADIEAVENEIAGIKTDYVKVADVVATVADETATTKVASEAAVVAALTWQVVE